MHVLMKMDLPLVPGLALVLARQISLSTGRAGALACCDSHVHLCPCAHSAPAFALDPSHTQAADLPGVCDEFVGECAISVNELLGCWGDNEFMPELTACIQRLLLKADGAIAIPCEWEQYVTPVFAPAAHAAIPEHQATYIWGGATAEPAMAELGPTTSVYRGRCNVADPEYVGTVVIPLAGTGGSGGSGGGGSTEGSGVGNATRFHSTGATAAVARKAHGRAPLAPDAAYALDLAAPSVRATGTRARDEADGSGGAAAVLVHGLMGHFTSRLYRNYVIDTRHNSPAFNAFHWEGFFFSVGARPLAANVGDALTATIRRKVAPYLPGTARYGPLADGGGKGGGAGLHVPCRAPLLAAVQVADGAEVHAPQRGDGTDDAMPPAVAGSGGGLRLHYEWTVAIGPMVPAGECTPRASAHTCNVDACKDAVFLAAPAVG
jgi:hypothetical protein